MMDDKKYKAELKKFVKEHNQLEDLLTPEQLAHYNSTEFPDNVQILHDALIAKLATEPDYEVWVPVRYYKYLLLNTVTGVKEFFTKFVFVSNKGNLFHLRKQPRMEKSNDPDTYQESIAQLTDEGVNFSVNRAVAVSFVPMPQDLKPYGYYALQVRHLDGKKGENDFRNLEWFAGNQNDQTVIDTDTAEVRAEDKYPELLSIHSKRDNKQYHLKPILIEVTLPGEFLGVRIIRSTQQELDELLGAGMASAAIYAANLNLEIYGCRWKYASNSEITQYAGFRVPAKLRTMLHEYAASYKGEILGTRVADGHRILINGDLGEVDLLSLNYPDIISVCNGEKEIHNGYTFRRVDEEELLTLRTELDLQSTTTFPQEDPVVNFIMGKRLNDGHLVLLATDQDAEVLGWDPKLVNKAAKKKAVPVYGFEFQRVTDPLMVVNIQNLIATQLTVL